MFLKSIKQSSLKRILWISFQEQGSEIVDIKNLTYILCNADSDFTETILHLEEVEELSDKFIDLS